MSMIEKNKNLFVVTLESVRNACGFYSQKIRH